MEKTEVIIRLAHFGYTYTESDSESLDFTISKTMQHILNVTNCEELPVELHYVAIDMVCAEFLKIKKAFGQLNDIVFEAVAKSVAMGDTNITFADDASPEQKFDMAIEYLLTGNNEDVIRCRKLVW